MLEKSTDGLCHIPPVSPEQFQVIIDALSHYMADYEGHDIFEKRAGLFRETWKHVYFNTKRPY